MTDKPSGPSGPTTDLKTGKPYTYTTSAIDPYDFDLYYLFDWGDETYSVVGPKDSGKTVSATHKWTEKGDYEIKVMAINTNAYWSDWSDSLNVGVSTKSKSVVHHPLIQFLQNFFENHPNLFPIIRELLGI